MRKITIGLVAMALLFGVGLQLAIADTEVIGEAQGVHIPLIDGKAVKPTETNTILGIIRDDFLVNDDTTGSCSQANVAVAMDASGNFVICWEDERDSGHSGVVYGYDIYTQRYDSLGKELGAHFRATDAGGEISHHWPSVSKDANGSFVICWQDKRNANDDIYAQRYSSGGDPTGANFKVNDDMATSYQSEPSVSMDGYGNFVMCWKDRRNGWENPDIYAQRYSSAGVPLGSNFKVNDDTETSAQEDASVAMGGDGSFVICWRDYRNDDSDIYAQRFSSTGNPLGVNFRVNDDVGSSRQYLPSIAMDGAGDFVICWTDERNGNGDIYAQRFSSTGNPLGANFWVNDDVETSFQGYPSAAMDGAGDFVICWENYCHGDYDIYAQRYNSLGDTVGSNFLVNDDEGTSDQLRPSVSIDVGGNFVISWDDYRNDRFPDIYAQRYSSSGNPVDSNFRVNNDVGVNWQSSSSIAMSREEGFIICWHDYRNGECDIYSQRYHSDGTYWGINYLVNQKPDSPNPCQWGPSVALDDNIITFTWTDARRSKGWDIYAKGVTWDREKVDEPEDDHLGLPHDYALLQNHPNPFNASSVISYKLPVSAYVKLEIYNILGQKVASLVDGKQGVGGSNPLAPILVKVGIQVNLEQSKNFGGKLKNRLTIFPESVIIKDEVENIKKEGREIEPSPWGVLDRSARSGNGNENVL
jgi:hypothetical protein